MSQPRNPHDKTVALTVHIRLSVLEEANHLAGELGYSRGQLYMEALMDVLEKYRAVSDSLARAFPVVPEEREPVRELGDQ